jgi:type III secretion protein HrpB1
MATLPKVAHIPAKIENVLAFRTTQGGEKINAGQSRELGTVDVASFDKIRLVVDERMGSTCNVIVRLTITENDEAVALLDHVMLTPQSQNTRVYDVPGSRIAVAIDGIGSAGTSATADVLIYGQY